MNKMRPSSLWLILMGLMLGTLACGTKTGTVASSSSSGNAAAAISVTPSTTAISAGRTQQFSASVSGATNTGVTWQVNNVTGGNVTVGTVSSSGLYTAPSSVPSGGSVTVSAISSDDSTKSASATVSITAAASATPATALANALYVATTGSNSNPCTQAAPCADPAYAANRATPGTTVEVAPGVYNYGGGAATFSKSGTAGNYIAVVCETRGACTIENSVTGNATVVMLSGNYLQLSGFEVMNTGSGNNLGFYVTGSNILISQNKIHQIEVDCSDLGGGGIQLANGVSNIVMDSNMIYDIGWQRGCPSSTVQFDGIIAETTGSGIQITNNIVYHVAGGWGLLYGNSSGSSGSVVISNNTVFSNANGGIAVVNGGDYSTISNNIVVDNGVVTGDCGIWTIYATDSHILMANNDVYGNAGGSFCSAGSPIMSGNISTDPALGTTFVNWKADGWGDYHEQSGSPTKSTGTSGCASGSPSYITPGVCAPGHDYDGNARSVSTTWDIGAYQYQ